MIDKNFEELVSLYFKNDLEKIDEYICSIVESHKDIEGFNYIYASLTNVIKAAHTTGSNWHSILEYIEEHDSIPVYGEDAEKLVVAVACKFLDAVGELNLEQEKECCDMGAEIETYSVSDEPVKSWDEYFFNVARQAARNSKCFSRRIGAVLVKDQSIISTGYNGPPRGTPTCDRRWKIDNTFIEKYGDKLKPDTKTRGVCPRKILGARSGEQMHLCVAGHAEENTILNCARLGISTMDTTMYMTCGIPCSKCLIKIINAGVKELVVTGHTYYDDSAKYLLENSDIKVRLFDFIL